MARLLVVESSPRGERSVSDAIVEAFVAGYRARHPDAAVDTLDVWRETLPEFDGAALEAKYAGIAGQALSPEQARAWDAIRALAQRFHAASCLVIGVPMWNFGIPYKLKHLIDLVCQKDVMFRFNPDGYDGMLKGKRAVLVCARGTDYGPDSSVGTPESGFDFQKSYMQMWLRYIGLTDIDTIVVERTLMGQEAEQAAREAGVRRARDLAAAA